MTREALEKYLLCKIKIYLSDFPEIEFSGKLDYSKIWAFPNAEKHLMLWANDNKRIHFLPSQVLKLKTIK